MYRNKIQEIFQTQRKLKNQKKNQKIRKKVSSLLTTKLRLTKTVTNHIKGSSNNKKNPTAKYESINEIQVSDLDTSTMTPWDGEVYLKCLQLQKTMMLVTQMKQND